MSSYTPGAAYFTANFNMAMIREDLLSHDETRQLSAMSYVIANMTTGKDMLGLFNEVAELTTVPNVHIKRLVYLYLIQNSRNHPEKAVLQSGAFVKDTLHNSPLTRGAALRAMTSLHIHILSDFVTSPLLRCLTDSDPYVRRTAVWGVVKQYHIAPEQTVECGLVDELLHRLRDENVTVVAAAVYAVGELRMRHCPVRVTRALGQAQGHLRALLRASAGRTTEWALCGLLRGLAVGMKVTTTRRGWSRTEPSLHTLRPAAVSGAKRQGGSVVVYACGERVSGSVSAAAYLTTAYDVMSGVRPYTMSDSSALAVAAVRVLLVLQQGVRRLMPYLNTETSATSRSTILLPAHNNNDGEAEGLVSRVGANRDDEEEDEEGEYDSVHKAAASRRRMCDTRGDAAWLLQRCATLAGWTMRALAMEAPRYETRYAALRLLRRLLRALPSVLLPRLRPQTSFFFPHVDDPVYVKKEKLSLLVTLATEATAPGVLRELRRYYDEDSYRHHPSHTGTHYTNRIHYPRADDNDTDEEDGSMRVRAEHDASHSLHMRHGHGRDGAGAGAGAGAGHDLNESDAIKRRLNRDKFSAAAPPPPLPSREHLLADDDETDDMNLLCRRSVWCTGVLAHGTPALANDCVAALHQLIQTRLQRRAGYVGARAEYAMYVLLRVCVPRFPGRWDDAVVAPLCAAVPDWRATRTQVAVIGFMGDYDCRTAVSRSPEHTALDAAETQTNPYIRSPFSSSSYSLMQRSRMCRQTMLRRLGAWVEQFDAVPAPVQLALLTALMKRVLGDERGCTASQFSWTHAHPVESASHVSSSSSSSSFPSSLSVASPATARSPSFASPHTTKWTREPHAMHMLRTVLAHCTRSWTTEHIDDVAAVMRSTGTMHLDVRDRGLLYYRLLQHDCALASRVVGVGANRVNVTRAPAMTAQDNDNQGNRSSSSSDDDEDEDEESRSSAVQTKGVAGGIRSEAMMQDAVGSAALSSLSRCVASFGRLDSVVASRRRVTVVCDETRDEAAEWTTSRWGLEDEEEYDWMGEDGYADMKYGFASDADRAVIGDEDSSSSCCSNSISSDSSESSSESEHVEDVPVTQVSSNDTGVTNATAQGHESMIVENHTSEPPRGSRGSEWATTRYAHMGGGPASTPEAAVDEDGYVTVLPACNASGVTARMKWSQIGTTLVLLCRFQLVSLRSAGSSARLVTTPPGSLLPACTTPRHENVAVEEATTMHSRTTPRAEEENEDAVHHARITALQINRNAFGLGVMQVFPVQLLDRGDRAVEVTVAVQCNNRRRATEVLELALQVEPVGVRFARAPSVPPALLLLPATGCDAASFVRHHRRLGPPAWTMLPISAPVVARRNVRGGADEGGTWWTTALDEASAMPYAYQRRCAVLQLTSHALRVHGLNLVRRREWSRSTDASRVNGLAAAAAAANDDDADDRVDSTKLVQFLLYAETIAHEALVIEAAVDAGVIILMTVRCAYAPLARIFGEYTLSIFTDTIKA